VRPAARFGKLEMDGDQVVEFAEKPEYEQGWTGGAFYVLEPGVFDYINTSPPARLRSRPGESECDNETSWEDETLERLAQDGQLMAYKHYSFWQGIETLRDRQLLEELWQAGNAPWKPESKTLRR
jgi:glucose-1-phosphate cytidylyltransferase